MFSIYIVAELLIYAFQKQWHYLTPLKKIMGTKIIKWQETQSSTDITALSSAKKPNISQSVFPTLVSNINDGEKVAGQNVLPTLVSDASDGENLAGSLMFLRSLRGAAVSTSGALSESEDLQQSEHCLQLPIECIKKEKKKWHIIITNKIMIY